MDGGSWWAALYGVTQSQTQLKRLSSSSSSSMWARECEHCMYHFSHFVSLRHFCSEVQVTQSCLTLCDPMDCLCNAWNSPGQNTGVSSLSLLQGIFPTQGLNPGLPHWGQILY